MADSRNTFWDRRTSRPFRPSMSPDNTQRNLVDATDVSGEPIGLIYTV